MSDDSHTKEILMNRTSAKGAILSLLLVLALVASACSTAETTGSTTTDGSAEPTETSAPEQSTVPPTETTVTTEVPPEPVTIDYWIPGGRGRDEGTAAVVEAFAALYPHITVEVTSLPFPEFSPALQVALAGNNPPDVALANGTDVQNLAFNGALASLDDVFDDADKADFMTDLVDMVTWDGTMYGAPWEQAAIAFFYNVDYFESAGIEVPTELSDAWTWPEFKANVQAVIADQAAAGNDITGIVGFQAPIQGTFFAWNVIRSNSAPGSPLWDGIAPDLSTVAGYVDTPEAVEAYEFWASLYEDGVSPREAIPDAFGSGSAATWMAVISVARGLDTNFPDTNWGLMPIPYFKTPITHTGSFTPIVPAKSDAMDAAKLFTEFVVSAEGFLAYHNVTPTIPGRLSVQAQLPEMNEGWLGFLLNSAVETGVARPGGPTYPIYDRIIGRDLLINIALGTPIDEAVATAIAEMDAQLGQFSP